VWHIANYRTDKREHNYFTEIVERISSLDEMRTRLDSAEVAASKPSE
jgi:hypothetical protein